MTRNATELLETLKAEYDIYHLGVSGGKDSTAVLLWLVNESGLPLDRCQVTFCDTGNEDLLTYAYLGMLNDKVFPIETIKPERDFWELAKWKKRFPSRRARFCTSFLKIIPSREHILKLQQNGSNVLLLNGVRSDEAHASNDRGNVEKFGWDDGFAADIYRPILDWSLDDVWRIHSKYLSISDVISLIKNDERLSTKHKWQLSKAMLRHGVPRNPLYDMGALRVGCFPCINSRKAEIRAMAKYRPERIDFIRDKEGSFNNAKMYSTMFARNTVPEQHRTKGVVTRDGAPMMVATIDDVVLWSQTSYGGKQYEMDLPIVAPPIACDLGGMCE